MIELKSTERLDRREKTILVGVILPDSEVTPDDPLDEIRGLAKTAGLIVVGSMLQKRQQVDIATYIGSGKVEELKELVEAHEADLVVFDNDLGPAQTRNLEKLLGVKVIDRTEVILDIFATRARTHEAHLQVELAQLEYAMPRLKRMWTHLSRYKGGIGVRGPGEKQLEEDRRLVVHRIQDLKAKLAKVQARKEREVAGRGDVPTVSLVGYTNAGKSTLMNALTDAGVLVEDKLFATLDTRTRRWRFRGRRAGPALRHRRVHPQPAARAGRVVQGDARGGPPGRPAAARRRRLEPRGREADPGRQGRARGARAGRPPDDPGPEQGRPRPRPLVPRRPEGAPRTTRSPSAPRGATGSTGWSRPSARRCSERALEAEVETGVENGRVLAYLAQHAQIHDRTYDEDRVRAPVPAPPPLPRLPQRARRPRPRQRANCSRDSRRETTNQFGYSRRNAHELNDLGKTERHSPRTRKRWREPIR